MFKELAKTAQQNAIAELRKNSIRCKIVCLYNGVSIGGEPVQFEPDPKKWKDKKGHKEFRLTWHIPEPYTSIRIQSCRADNAFERGIPYSEITFVVLVAEMVRRANTSFATDVQKHGSEGRKIGAG